MEAVAAEEPADEVTAELAAMLARFTALAVGPDDDDVDDANRIDRIAVLERIKAAAAAAQHTEMVRFARSPSGRTARADRRVTLRRAPDTMSLLTGLLPVEHGVACLAALRRHSDALIAAGDSRGRGQIMADTLVERLTGQARAADVNVEVGIVMPLSALVATNDRPARNGAEVAGQAPVAVRCRR